MPIVVKAYADADDVLIAWEPSTWSADWVGFQLERRNDATQEVVLIANRIPPRPGQGPVPAGGVSSAQSPIRRCLWTDHNVVSTGSVSYRVTAVSAGPNGRFAADPSSVSAWAAPVVATGDAGKGLQAYFNRGTLMSQVVSRFVQGEVTEDALRGFLQELADPSFQARQYLGGDARTQMLEFLHDADLRSSTIHAAIYEINDQELVGALKPFGRRGHILIGNGSGTKPWVAQQLTAAGWDVRHRDLSNGKGSSPSVHNKFVVESEGAGATPSRVLTGSTNWTTTGLCTQLNNVLIVENAAIAARYAGQWDMLAAAGNAMPASLKASNAKLTTSGEISVMYAATPDGSDLQAMVNVVNQAKQGVLFLMFMPGQSPVLDALLELAKKNQVYVRGVVSTVTASKSGNIGTVGGQVVKSGSPAQSFHRDVLLPAGISAADRPSWAETEFTVQEIRSAGLNAIVHSKCIVVDPFSDGCVVITGSHNMSVSASQKNDENLVFVRGNRTLAQMYAVHINGVYDHYSWRSYLASGGDPNLIYNSLQGWQPGGARAQELAFWMQSSGAAPAAPSAPAKKARAKKGAAKKRAAKKAPAKRR